MHCLNGDPGKNRSECAYEWAVIFSFILDSEIIVLQSVSEPRTSPNVVGHQ
jgi:hypothetical protein